MTLSLPLSPQVFAILSALIEERMGLHYDIGERELARGPLHEPNAEPLLELRQLAADR